MRKPNITVILYFVPFVEELGTQMYETLTRLVFSYSVCASPKDFLNQLKELVTKYLDSIDCVGEQISSYGVTKDDFH